LCGRVKPQKQAEVDFHGRLRLCATSNNPSP